MPQFLMEPSVTIQMMLSGRGKVISLQFCRAALAELNDPMDSSILVIDCRDWHPVMII